MIKDIHIIEIQSRDKKSSYAKEILEMLPKWFGNKQTLDEYVEKVKIFHFLLHLMMPISVLVFFQ